MILHLRASLLKCCASIGTLRALPAVYASGPVRTPLQRDYAQWLASIGIHVFPLNPANKRPYSNIDVAAALGRLVPNAGEGGMKFATTDGAALKAWWACWPDALIGIRTGHVSGLYVLDVDRKNGKDGYVAINANNWTIPNTVAVQTPSGGAHYYFRIPRDDQRRWKSDADQLGSGLDRRGDDSYVVWYGADLSQPIAEPPSWMTTDIQPRKDQAPNETRKPLGTDRAPNFNDATRALYSTDPNEMNYDDWRNISCAFRQSATGLGVDDAMVRVAWDGWCAQYTSNSSADNEKLWRSTEHGTSVGWSYLRGKAPLEIQFELMFGAPHERAPQQPSPISTPTMPMPHERAPQSIPAPLDGYQSIISTSTDDSGKSTLIETVKLLHGQLNVALDEFSQSIFATGPLPWDLNATFPRRWTELDTLHTVIVANALFKTPGKDTAFDAVTMIANRKKFHSVRDYLNRLQWDGAPRLAGMLTTYFGVPHSDYSIRVGCKFMIAAVARVMKPGCKADNVLVLEGPQGAQKSSSLNALVGDDWFADELPDLHSKDAAIQLDGKWIVEVAELSALKRSDVETVKKFMSRKSDRYRAPYEKIANDHPRQCLFVGTTNDKNYLKDQTGNRRFWPATCGTIDTAGLRRDRDQLWAEALLCFTRGDIWWFAVDEEHLARAEQELRREIDQWEEPINVHLKALNGRETTVGAICVKLGIPFEKQNSTVNKRIVNCLKHAGYERRQIDRHWCYVKSDDQPHTGFA